MAIPKGHRFPIEFDVAFPKGLVLNGGVEPANEYQSSEDRDRGREARQRLDDRTGKRLWRAVVTDPDETRAKRASFEVLFTADVVPVPFGEEALPGMRPVVLDGLEVEPKLTGQGEYKSLTYQVWATGFADPKQTAGRTPVRGSAQGKEQAA